MALDLGVKPQVFAFVSHVLGIAAAVLVLVWCIHFRGGLAFEATNKSLIFNIHPVLMLIGFIFLGGEAIIAYKVLPMTKYVKKNIHLILHAIALVLGFVRIHAAFKYHNESNIDNLYSLHSWLGLGAICLYAIQWLLGFVVFFYPGAAVDLRAKLLPWHVFFGLFVYVLALATALIGFLEKLTFLESSGLYKYGPEAFLVNSTALVVVFYGAFVVLTAAVSPEQIDESSSYVPLPEN